jgi:hypothetical protein
MMEFDYRKGRPVLLEKDARCLHLHVGRGTTTFALSLFFAVIVVWLFALLFIGNPLHHTLLLLLVPLGRPAFAPLVKTDLEASDGTYVLRRHLFGVGPRTAGEVADLKVDLEREGLYDGDRRLAPLTPAIGQLVQDWLRRRRADGYLRVVHPQE